MSEHNICMVEGDELRVNLNNTQGRAVRAVVFRALSSCSLLRNSAGNIDIYTLLVAVSSGALRLIRDEDRAAETYRTLLARISA